MEVHATCISHTNPSFALCMNMSFGPLCKPNSAAVVLLLLLLLL
jgi:hypothetical protein